MAITWAEITRWSSGTLHGYTAAVDSRKSVIDQQIATLQSRRTSFQGEGQTADALRNAIDTAHTALSNLSSDLQDLRDAISQTVGRVIDVEVLIQKAKSAAAECQCAITVDGKVITNRTSTDPRTADVDVDALVRNAISEAEHVDDFFVSLLAKAGNENSARLFPATGARPWTEVEKTAFVNMSSEERAAYWSKLPYAQKQYLCDHYPDLIGNADGVEAWARDRANRLRLPKLRQAAEAEVTKLDAELKNVGDNTALKTDLQIRLEEAKNRVKAYDAVQVALQQKGRIPLEDYQRGAKGEAFSLLTLEEENGRVLAAVAQGDVDHAKNVATVVPGIGTTVQDMLKNEITKGTNLRNAAAAEGNINTKDVAVVSWLGYEAPPGPSADLGEDLKIARIDLADKGSDKLAGFLTGVNASRKYGAGDANMTLLGHSYGSVVSGRATTKIADGVVDNEILFGSPGMGTYDPSEIHVPQGHRFVSGVPEGDFVQGVSGKRFRYYGIINTGFAISPLLPEARTVAINNLTIAEFRAEQNGFGQLGMNPLSHNSTFVHISGDATGSKEYNPLGLPSWTIIPDTTNHSVYTDQGTQTLRDMGRIVAGGKRQLIGAPIID